MAWPKGRPRKELHTCPCGGGVAKFRARVNLYKMKTGRDTQHVQSYGASFECCNVCLSKLSDDGGELIRRHLRDSLIGAFVRQSGTTIESGSEAA